MKNKTSRKFLSLLTVFGLMSSMAVTTQAADSGLTRGELAALLVERAGLSSQAAAYQNKPSAFSDVAEGSLYEGQINLVREKGWMCGDGNRAFRPEAKVTQLETVAAVMQFAEVPDAMLTSWPDDYNETADRVGITAQVDYRPSASISRGDAQQMVNNGAALIGRPYIGITWKSPTQDYAGFKAVIRAAGGNPVELDQVMSTAVMYEQDGTLKANYMEKTGMLKQEYADVIKEKDASMSNVPEVMAGIDGVFFTGGEDVSPSLFAVPQKEDNEGEAINATRDISDYTLMAYCLNNDVPTFAACRGMQVMSIVSGTGFIQDINNYYKSMGKTYSDTHRMPPDAPNRTHARHNVEIVDKESWLYDIVDGDVLENVSSWHHQAVGSVEGTGLTVVAKTTENGVDIVEAVENKSKTFCLGVQFHPENDCKLALYDNTPEKALCDLNTCMQFFRTLVRYAGGQPDTPVIGISWGGDPQDFVDISAIVEKVGGVAVQIPQIKSYDEALIALSTLDGVVMTGGEDVDPALYNDVDHGKMEEVNKTRDTSDYNIIKVAVEKDIPMLAICRGEQMLNVVCGGGLIQDLPTHLNTPDSKVHRNAPDWARHDIQVTDRESWLYEIVGGDTLKNVASWHHQAVDPNRLGKGLTVVSTYSDGVIEAVEYQDNRFTLGVQFHPEADAMDQEVFLAFFDTLVDYAA